MYSVYAEQACYGQAVDGSWMGTFELAAYFMKTKKNDCTCWVDVPNQVW